ncbi:MAG: glutamine synthetase, partial [Bdellovibrionales bacterium]|nr:glutamine synthetase [Bdellovibrionales bacterium]
MTESSHEKIINNILKDESINKIKLAVTDIDGVLRGKYIHKSKFESIVKGGFSFCDVIFGWDSADLCYDNSKVTGWHTGYPDAKVALDFSTYRQVPWDNNVPFFLGHFEDEIGNRLDVCPRNLLRTEIDKANKN